MFKSDNHSEADTLIGPSVKVVGDFSSQGNVHIEGGLKGTLETTANLTVGEHAHVVADVKAQNAYIAGSVKGNLVVAERLELAPTSHIDGDVSAKILVVTEGAQLDGRCQMASPASIVPGAARPAGKKTATVAQEA
jgi:cytoskeletal protein CcmA (bactofilin family)